MLNKSLFILVKFGQKEYMRELMKKGIMHLKPIKEFRKIEHSEIGDSQEGLSHYFAAKDLQMTYGGKSIPGVTRIKINMNANPHLFCLYGFFNKHVMGEDGALIDKRNYSFGESAVVIKDVAEFIRRVREFAAFSGYGCQAQPIDYSNSDAFIGEYGPFKKLEKFNYQNEYRFAFMGVEHTVPFNIEIGSIEDISEIIDSEKLESQISIKTGFSAKY